MGSRKRVDSPPMAGRQPDQLAPVLTRDADNGVCARLTMR
jgi:hypothetical protein